MIHGFDLLLVAGRNIGDYPHHFLDDGLFAGIDLCENLEELALVSLECKMKSPAKVGGIRE